MRWIVRAFAMLLALAGLAWAGLHWFIVPRIDDFRPRLESLATQALGTAVRIGLLRAESNGLVPTVSVHDLRVLDASGQDGLHVPRILVTFSLASLLRGNLEQLAIEEPVLRVQRTVQGRLLVGGIDLSGDAAADTSVADWVFSQEEIVVRGGSIRWIDDLRGAAPIDLDQVNLLLQNGLRRHQLRLDATPEAGWGERFTLIGQFRQPLLSRHAGEWRNWDGRIYALLPRFDVARWPQLADFRERWALDLRSGVGALRLWAEVRRGEPTAMTADLALRELSLTLGPQLEPLAFASLQGRLAWREQQGGAQISTRELRFVDAEGVAWPGGNVSLSWRDGQHGAAAGGELRGDRLDLAALARIATRLPLPMAVREPLQRHWLAGVVENVQARWDGSLQAPSDWRVQAQVTGLALGRQATSKDAPTAAQPDLPGVTGLTLKLDAGAAGGQATLAIRGGSLEFPGVFEDPRIPLADLSAQARWRVQGERIDVEVNDLKLANADASGQFTARWHSGEASDGSGPRFPGVLDLQGSFSRANAARVHRYLPLSIPTEARHYVRDSIHKGEGRDIAVRVQGKLREIPFNLPGEVGQFRFAGPVGGVTMTYVPTRLQPAGQAPWPPLEAVSGELVFERAGMQVRGATARVQGHPGWQFANIQTEIADFNRPLVKVSAEGRGALTAALSIVRESPVASFTRHALDDASATGDAGLELKLDLPVADLPAARVRGRVQLQGNDLRLSAGSPPLAQARGAVGFSDSGFSIEGARVQLLGGEAQVNGGSLSQARADAPRVQVRASGTASAEGLRQMREWAPVAALARRASGSAAYEAQIDFHGSEPEVEVRSDLRGLAFDLPPPLTKNADAAWPLLYETRRVVAPGAAPGERLRVQVADVLALDYERTDGSPARVRRGAIAAGAGAVKAFAVPESGVRGRVDLAQVDVDAWEQVARQLADTAPPGGATPATDLGSAYLPGTWALRIGELRVDERVLHDVVATVAREGTLWRSDVQARELAGRLEYAEGTSEQAGHVRARLSRLAIPAGDGQESPLTQPSTRYPALDVVVDSFELRGKKLGQLDVQAVNRDIAARTTAAPVQEWQLTRLALTMPEASFSASGRWAAVPGAPALPMGPRTARSGDDRRRTLLDFKLDIRDAGKLLTRLDMPGVVLHGQGAVTGRLGWIGSPFSPHYPSMEGQLHLDVGAGQFLKADPGIGKLLGVLSLQALPRRLTLDFRDVFSSGFSFDFVRGDIAVQQGVATTHNLQMKGVNAAVLMEGSADLDQETQDLRVLVVPELDAGTAALAAAVINPVIGIGAFLAQLVLKRPLIKATTREFEVRGSWDNPEIVPVKVAPDAASAPPAVPTPTATATAKEKP